MKKFEEILLEKIKEEISYKYNLSNDNIPNSLIEQGVNELAEYLAILAVEKMLANT